MKILYYTNTKYAWEVQGTMKSIAEEVQGRGHSVYLMDMRGISSILQKIEKLKPDSIWLASSDLKIEEYKSKINIPVVGFGFSDPYYFSPDRFKSYDIYVSNHEDTIKKYSHMIPMIYNPTACDIKFHKNYNYEKIVDVSMIGTTNHPRFIDPLLRAKYVKRLRDDGISVHAYGDGWTSKEIIQMTSGKVGNSNYNHFAVKGDSFLSVINRSHIGLDLQDFDSPLAHRMFEYGACGTPCITRNRPEVFNLFSKSEILVYNNYEDLKNQIKYYLKNKDELISIGKRLEVKCRKEHNISNRIDHLLKELNRLGIK